jgi:HSP20 family protein
MMMMVRNPIARRQNTSLLDEFLKDEFFLPSFTQSHDIDVYQEDNNYIVELELAGYKKEDIQLAYNNDLLTIKAEHNEEKNDENKKYIYRSRSRQSFTRQVRFNNIDGTKIDASYDQGILKIVLPIKGEQEVVNRIEVK